MNSTSNANLQKRRRRQRERERFQIYIKEGKRCTGVWVCVFALSRHYELLLKVGQFFNHLHSHSCISVSTHIKSIQFVFFSSFLHQFERKLSILFPLWTLFTIYRSFSLLFSDLSTFYSPFFRRFSLTFSLNLVHYSLLLNTIKNYKKNYWNFAKILVRGREGVEKNSNTIHRKQNKHKSNEKFNQQKTNSDSFEMRKNFHQNVTKIICF